MFIDFPHDPDEQTAAAVESYMLFEIEFWKALTTNVVPPGPWGVASDDVIAWIEGQVGPNSANGIRAGGTMGTATSIVSSDGSTIVIDVCSDLSEVMFVSSDGSTSNAIGAGEDPSTGTRLTLIPGAGSSWKVSAYELTGSC